MSFSTCINAEQTATTPPILKDALSGESPSAEEHFERPGNVASMWSPPVCNSSALSGCKVQILHISKTGYDEGLVEELVEKLQLRANNHGINNMIIEHAKTLFKMIFG